HFTNADEIDPAYAASVAADISADDTTRWGNSSFPTGVSGNLLTHDGNNWIAKDLVLSTSNTGQGIPISIVQPSIAINYIIALTGIYPSRSFEPFVAQISMFGGNFAPRNWAFCDGQLLAISSHTALFSLLGTTYGGDGRTTFALPDLRGRTPVHAGNGPGLSPRALGSKFGSEQTTLTTNNLPSHNHTVTVSFE
ncbi:tail fiber protein, partial [Sunxiuqinia rutila]